MAGSQFRNASDVHTAMTQFAAGTSQETAKGSFAPLTSLTALSDAIVCLCDEITQLRAEVDELRTRANSAARGGKRDIPRPKSLLKKKAKKAVRSRR
jgi:hypothetical protein